MSPTASLPSLSGWLKSCTDRTASDMASFYITIRFCPCLAQTLSRFLSVSGEFGQNEGPDSQPLDALGLEDFL